jgi:hypothetical protein
MLAKNLLWIWYITYKNYTEMHILKSIISCEPSKYILEVTELGLELPLTDTNISSIKSIKNFY